MAGPKGICHSGDTGTADGGGGVDLVGADHVWGVGGANGVRNSGKGGTVNVGVGEGDAWGAVDPDGACNAEDRGAADAGGLAGNCGSEDGDAADPMVAVDPVGEALPEVESKPGGE